MKQIERDLLARIYGCLGSLISFAPSNPTDMKRLAITSSHLLHSGEDIRLAISMLGFGDYEYCASLLDDIEQVLA